MTAALLTAFTLAQLCWLESGFSQVDCIAEVYVIRRRAYVLDTSTTEAAYRYSALHNDTPRSRFAQALRPGLDFPGALPVPGAWLQLQNLALAALLGHASDPCNADHWGAARPIRLSPKHVSYDRINARKRLKAGEWRRAKCTSDTINSYYKSASARKACLKNGGSDVC